MLKELPTMGELHIDQRKRLTDRHLTLMEKIMKDNSHKSKYWIMGKAKCKRKNGRTTITPTLKAYDVQPGLEREAYLYEVDNTLGTKSLLWVFHPNDKLSMPSIGKSIRIADDLGVNNLPTEVSVDNGSN
jgi:hypothetical protein